MKSVQKSQASVPRIHSLDGLRGILALFVVAFHYVNQFPEVRDWIRPNLYLLLNGGYPVWVFFAMSGFVMSYVYGDIFKAGSSHTDLGRFLWARVARLIPVHLVMLAVLAIGLSPLWLSDRNFLAPGTSLSLDGLLASIFFLQGPWFDDHVWNYPAWSVSVEWHLYLLFPMVAGLFVAKKPALAAVVFGTLLAFGITWAARTYPDVVKSNGGMSLLSAGGLFVAGMGLHAVWQARGLGSGLVAIAAIAGTAYCLSFRQWVPYSILLIPFVLLGTLRNPLMRGVLSFAPVAFLGTISYSLYMSHAVLQMLTISRPYYLRNFRGDAAAEWLGFWVSIALAVVVATMVYLLVELPMRKALVAIGPKRRRVETVAIAA